MTSLYNIDRQTASSVLGVSVRTVDRYIASGLIKKVKNQGRTWLSNSDVQELLRQNTATGGVEYVAPLVTKSSSDNTKKETVFTHESVSQSKIQNDHKDKEYSNLEKIYQDTKVELETKNQKLQQAIYKIGQLEAQLRNMIPQIEVQKRERLLEQNNKNLQEQLQTEIQKRELVVKNLLSDIKYKEHELETERFNKAIFAVLLFFTIVTMLFSLIYKFN